MKAYADMAPGAPTYRRVPLGVTASDVPKHAAAAGEASVCSGCHARPDATKTYTSPALVAAPGAPTSSCVPSGVSASAAPKPSVALGCGEVTLPATSKPMPGEGVR